MYSKNIVRVVKWVERGWGTDAQKRVICIYACLDPQFNTASKRQFRFNNNLLIIILNYAVVVTIMCLPYVYQSSSTIFQKAQGIRPIARGRMRIYLV